MNPSRPRRDIESRHVRALLAGGIAGTTVDLTLHPLDTLKTRLQASHGFARSGGFHGIYKGVGSALVGSAPGAALFFTTYEASKAFLAQARPGRGSEPLEHMLAASAGEVAACAVRVPTEVIKQRAQAGHYPSSWAALRDTVRRGAGSQSGWGGVARELYRGWSVTVMREVPFTVIQFPLWEGMKDARRRATGRHGVSAVESALFGSVAGAVAAGVTTPLDVLKTRLMLSKEEQHVLPLLTQILRDSGPRAFFAGIGPRIVWISLGGAIFLGSYEWAHNTLGG
ncbi:MAG: S-adenosylmethionine transporter [Thelocarpon superellum]|nr:MAG: S-adenosylmethionine transporter [Thelocarpon superellum]